MDSDVFDIILKQRLEKISSTLKLKANEYAKVDRLYNFKRAGKILNQSPDQALIGMFMKHLVCVLDMVESDQDFPDEYIDEKVGDAINYLILLEALLKERV
jgi:hypothetical protein